jgi:hypothetical protein
MRRLIVFCLVFAGCGGSTAYFKDYDIGVEKQATVGSVMVTVSNQEKIATHTNKILQQLIYGGTTGRVARITYREFGEDLTRPTFFQDLQYDLNESDIVVYQDISLQVIEASPKQIRFKVLTGPAELNSSGEPKRDEPPPKFSM